MYQTRRNVPVELDQAIDKTTFDKSREYQLDKSTFSLFHDFFKQIEFLVSHFSFMDGKIHNDFIGCRASYV